VDELQAPGKPFASSKRAVRVAWERVRANGGAAGVDGVSVEEPGSDLRNNLYKIWNRMSSGTYFPPPVKAVEIPKAHGPGTRMLGVPTVAGPGRADGGGAPRSAAGRAVCQAVARRPAGTGRRDPG